MCFLLFNVCLCVLSASHGVMVYGAVLFVLFARVFYVFACDVLCDAVCLFVAFLFVCVLLIRLCDVLRVLWCAVVLFVMFCICGCEA